MYLHDSTIFTFKLARRSANVKKNIDSIAKCVLLRSVRNKFHTPVKVAIFPCTVDSFVYERTFRFFVVIAPCKH